MDPNVNMMNYQNHPNGQYNHMNAEMKGMSLQQGGELPPNPNNVTNTPGQGQNYYQNANGLYHDQMQSSQSHPNQLPPVLNHQSDSNDCQMIPGSHPTPVNPPMSMSPFIQNASIPPQYSNQMPPGGLGNFYGKEKNEPNSHSPFNGQNLPLKPNMMIPPVVNNQPPFPGQMQSGQAPFISQMQPNMPGGPPLPINPTEYQSPLGNNLPNPMNQGGMMPPTSFKQVQGPPMPQNNYGYNQPMMNQPQPKFSTDSLPSVVDVMLRDQELQKSVIFGTGQRGVTPPLVTTDFVCRDEGNCNPKFIRSSLYAVPNSSELLDQIGVNFTLTCSPFAKQNISDTSVIISDMGPQGPVRCIRCKAYMNPYNLFTDGGRRFQCALCSAPTEVPADYFAHVDHTGRRSDSTQRPELCLGSYELYATKNYCRDTILPKPPAYIFLLEVSQSSLKSGFLQMFCHNFVSKILPSLPQPDLSYKQQEQWLADNLGKEDSIPKHIDLPIGFITYGNQLHFYSFTDVVREVADQTSTTTMKTPHMNIVADAEEMFVPGVEGFLVNSSNTEAIQTLMEIIPNQFLNNSSPVSQTTLLGPAIQAGYEALKASNRPGKLFLFHTYLPTAEAPGRLKNREDAKIIGTDKEKNLLAPANNFYTELGQQLVKSGVSVDYFLMPTSYVDIASISEVPKLTGGRIYKYPCFQADRQGDDLLNDLALAVTLPQAFDCVMRLRTSTGTRPVDYFANAHIPNSTDIEVGAVDSDWGLTVEIKHDDKLREDDVVIIQLAVLFTSLSGERRLRIHNLTLNASNKPPEIFLLSDHDVFVNFMVKSAVRAVMNKQKQGIFEEITNKLTRILAAYKKLCCGQDTNMNQVNPGELVLPERLKLMPYFVQSIFKTPIIKSANVIGLDTRSLALFNVMRMDVIQSATYLYPRIYPLHELLPEEESLPVPIRCSIERFKSVGAYFVDNGGFNNFLWLGNELSTDWLMDIFGVNNVRSVPDGAIITERNNQLSKRIYEVYSRLRERQTRSAKLILVRQTTEQEAWMKNFMFEDKSNDNSPSYTEYLIHLHKEIRTLVK